MTWQEVVASVVLLVVVASIIFIVWSR